MCIRPQDIMKRAEEEEEFRNIETNSQFIHQSFKAKLLLCSKVSFYQSRLVLIPYLNTVMFMKVGIRSLLLSINRQRAHKFVPLQ
jgi:hypothetical protein